MGSERNTPSSNVSENNLISIYMSSTPLPPESLLYNVVVPSSTLVFSVPGTLILTSSNHQDLIVLDPLILILSYPVLALCHTMLYFSNAVLLIFSIFLALSSCTLGFAQSSSPLSPTIIWDLLNSRTFCSQDSELWTSGQTDPYKVHKDS